MAEIICSVVVDEAASKLSSLLSGENGDWEMSHEHKVERLEMAVLKLQTALAVSEDYLPLTHRPLIRWKAKLKRVAKEGKGVLRFHKKQILKQSKRSNKNTIWQGISRAAKLFVPFIYGAEELSVATVERFERFADHGSEFIKFVEHGGRCARSLPLSLLPSLARSLGAGEAVEQSLRIRSGTAVLLLQPWWLEEHDDQGNNNTKIACLWMSYDHDVAWEKSLKMMVAFYLSDSVDIMKIAMNSIELLPSQLCTARAAMKELVAEMALHGLSSPAPSPLYLRFVRGIQNSHRYGFAPNPRIGGSRSDGRRLQVLPPDPILLACAHFYVVPPAEKSNRAAAAVLELVWHTSPRYQPKKLSEHHQVVGLQQMDEDVIPKAANGGGFLGEDGAFYNHHERQWWCPQSSTRLSVVPLLSPPTTLPQWCQRQAEEQHSTSVSPPIALPTTAGQLFQGSIKK